MQAMVEKQDVAQQETSEKGYNISDIFKFLGCSLFGCFMFLYPWDTTGGTYNTALSVLTEALDKAIQENVPWLLTVVVVFSAISALVGCFWKIQKSGRFSTVPAVRICFNTAMLRLTKGVLSSFFTGCSSK